MSRTWPQGFTGRMLELFGIAPQAFTAAVAAANTDDDVAAYIRDHPVADSAEAWNTNVLNRQIYHGDRAEAIAEHPWLAEHAEIQLSSDFLQYLEDNGLDD
jgi:hypothetical protein